MSGKPKSQIAEKRLWLLRMLGIVMPILSLEFVTRLADPCLEGFRDCYFGGDESSPLLFVNDRQIGWKLRPSTEVVFTSVKVSTNSISCRSEEISKTTNQVLCLGDSATFGWRVAQDQAYPAVLQRHLNEANVASVRWQVQNAGVPGYCSAQIVVQLQRLLEHLKPNAIVICASNNETWPVNPTQRPGTATPSSGIVTLLKSSRFVAWAAEQVASPGEPPYAPHSDSGSVARVSRREYKDNLNKLLALATSATKNVIVVVPPVNLLQPFEGRDGRNWEHHYLQVFEFAEKKRFDEGVAYARALRVENPDSHHPRWLLGYLHNANADRDAARTELEAAFNLAEFPDRLKPSYREILVHVAETKGVVLLDANELIQSKQDTTRLSVEYLDHCHPTVRGHELIATGIAQRILSVAEQEYLEKR